MAASWTKEASDGELVEAALEGRARAFEALLERHEGKVLRVLRLLGVPAQEREDVAQDVFVRVFRHLGGFRRGRSFGAWIYRVSVNAAHDHRARQGRLTRAELPWSEGLDTPDQRPGPGEAMQSSDLRIALESALALLTERERAVFVLRELEGLETAEVAQVLGIASITVRRHLTLARRRLRQQLEGLKKNWQVIDHLEAEGSSN